jgi:polysaccharide export outer membrane protein
MKRYTRHPLQHGFLAMFLLLITFACAPVGKLKYVADNGPGSITNDYKNDRTEKNIQPYDYLYIKIFSLDEKTNAIFNERNYSVDNELISYSVDAKGDVILPFIGEISVKELTINEARQKIEKAMSAYLNNISVIVRFVSNKITVLGEVTAPGQHPFYDEKVSVFQALGFAGGTSGYGDLTNVTLIREKDNVIKYYYLDLTKKNIASSEYYYLLPNDIIIINPIKAKYRELRDYAVTLSASILTSLSALLSIYIITKSL